MPARDIESENLAAHVAACEERYKTLFHGLSEVKSDVRGIKRTGFRVAVAVIVKLLAVLGVLIGVLWQMRDAKAMPPVCAARAAIAAILAGEYGETPLAFGLANDGDLIEVWAAPDGSWSITATAPGGRTCLTGAGEGWERLPKPKPEERES